ncbi:iron chaperone [Leucobacter musarum]|uniref:iron chaperone n=1 Tax=Leucobacter musarum TaxID=1930747 RepID=UPI0006A7D64F|nr:DUF1801 domain-containing protein [Leucobacter musarum]
MTYASHDEYIDDAPERFRPMLSALREVIARSLPEAEQIIKYDMPGFRIGDTIVASYASFSRQCGLYLSPTAISAHADELAEIGLKPTKTGITFPVNKPIPDDLVLRLVRASRDAAA